MNNRKLSFVVSTTAAIAMMFTSFNLLAPVTASAQSTPLYKACEDYKLTAPINLDAAPEATEDASAATPAPTEAADTDTSADNIAFLSVVGSESEACYVTSETFLQGNFMNLPTGFNGAVGVTKTISGDIALDLTNVANSQVGDITINISEFKSDNDRRDGFIRQNFLELNKYPFATLTNATVIGLPTGPYTEGTTLKFQIEGTLTVHNTARDTTFDATGSYTDGTLVVTATTDLKMSDFGIEVPNIGGLLKVDDPMRLVVNLVSRASEATPTPAS